jgi:predicted DNA-binding transcriptional regulator AlpA
MMVTHEEHLLTIPQLSEEIQVPVSWLYERSRLDRLPGKRRVGKYVRVDRHEFFTALKDGSLR